MLMALVLGWAIIYADRTCLYPLLSVISEELSLTSTQAGTLTSAYFMVYVLTQVPAGIVGDRIGLKRVLMAMFAVAACGMLGLGLYGSGYFTLLIFAGLHGLGAGAFYPTAFGTMLQVAEPARRGFSSAVVGIGMALGLLLGLAASGPIYEALNSYRAPFIILSIPTFALIIYFYFALPNIKGTRQPSWREYKAILTDKDIWLIILAAFTSLYGFWVAITWGPTFLKMERSFSLGQAGFYTGLVAITAIPAGLFWGKMSDRYGRKIIALIVLPLTSIVLYCLSLVTSPAAIIGVLLFYGMLSNSAFIPVMLAWLTDVVSSRYPGYMGAALGIFNCAIMTSAIVAPPVSGYLRDRTGSLVSAILAGSLIVLAGTVLVFFLPDTKPKVYNVDKQG